ncbi:MAG: hypothetical protein WBN29_13355, partial [Polyangiales bacterium]
MRGKTGRVATRKVFDVLRVLQQNELHRNVAPLEGARELVLCDRRTQALIFLREPDGFFSANVGSDHQVLGFDPNPTHCGSFQAASARAADP